MAIGSLYIGNFKGIAAPRWIDLRPLTIFVGANSSGKSSCLHGLASLSQTIKISNNSRPLVLDDEYASVNLGRFVEVAHSVNYKGEISLGIKSDTPFRALDLPKLAKHGKSGAEFETVSESYVTYNFDCTLRTQAIRITSLEACVSGITYSGRRTGSKFTLRRNDNKAVFELNKSPGLLDVRFILDEAKPSQHLVDFFPLLQLSQALSYELKSTLYLGPFRQPPRRMYATRGASPSEVGPEGEAAVVMLANEAVQKQVRPAAKLVTTWLSHIGLGKKIGLSRVGTSDLFGTAVTLADNTELSLSDLGYGVSQVLPVLVQCAFAPDHSTLLFEQPELHLHPEAAKKLAKVFAETAVSKKTSVVVETHSAGLVNGVQDQIRQGVIDAADVALYRVRRVNKESEIERLDVDDDGDIYQDWHHGFLRS